MPLNVLGGQLAMCGLDPLTGWLRNGCCETNVEDVGSHTVCAIVTDEFLAFTASRGNRLDLEPGDRWCLCASRYKEALDAGVAPPVVLEACEEGALDVVPLAALRALAHE